jgi:diguanylate cyclase (GGDEF)-like protein/hemerythrin-like metal-binding protein
VDEVQVDPRSLGALLTDSAVIALAVVRRGVIIFANPAFIRLFRTSGTLLDIPLATLISDGSDGRLGEALVAAERTSTRYFGLGRRDDGPSFDIELCLETATLGSAPAVIAFAWDVTEQHRSHEQLAYLAYSDTLTGLANRVLFADRLHQAAQLARRYSEILAVLLLDLDGFKAVNDAYGHEAGDMVLQFVAQRLQNCIREGDTLARIGGDEFAVLLPRLPDLEAAALVAERILSSLEEPFEFAHHSVMIGASIGIAAWPEHAGWVDALLAAADTAMYQAKRLGKNQVQWATRPSGDDLAGLQPLAWGAAHAIGIRDIDDQHMRMAELIDELSASLRGGGDRDACLAELDALIRYAAMHFATEEGLMEQHKVADFLRHRDEHRRLLHDIRNLQIDGDIPRAGLILRYLREWLVRHVDSMDRQLGQALLAKGCR